MGKFLNDEYEEVTAFTQEEMDAKIAEAVEKAKAEAGGSASELEKKVKELEADKAKVEEKLSKRSEEYNNLKKAYDKGGETIKTVEEEKKSAYEKLRDTTISKVAGDDKEYEEELRKQYDRFGEQTLDPTVLEAHLKDAHTLAVANLNRDFTPFSMGAGGGRPPERKTDEKKNFTETSEGEATLDMINLSLGQLPAKKEEQK